MTPSMSGAVRKRKPRTESTSSLALPPIVGLPAREQAKLLYVFDQQQRSVRWHWESRWSKAAAWDTFERWSVQDGWHQTRKDTWTRMVELAHQEALKRGVKTAVQDIEWIEDLTKGLYQKFKPLRDANGNLILDPTNGTPTFAVGFQSYEGGIAALVKLMTLMALKRGEATSRSEVLDPNTPLSPAYDPVAKKVQFTIRDFRQLAAAVLTRDNEDNLLEALPVDKEEKTDVADR